MNKDFIIDQVSWHTRTPGNPEPRDHIVARFYAVVAFLQNAGLTVQLSVRGLEDIDDEFAIRSCDLTAEGLSVMRSTYDKWLQKVDAGLDPTDVTLFEKALAKMKRNSK